MTTTELIDDSEPRCIMCSACTEWTDCDQGHEWCFQLECTDTFHCGYIDRDCEEAE